MGHSLRIRRSYRLRALARYRTTPILHGETPARTRRTRIRNRDGQDSRNRYRNTRDRMATSLLIYGGVSVLMACAATPTQIHPSRTVDVSPYLIVPPTTTTTTTPSGCRTLRKPRTLTRRVRPTNRTKRNRLPRVTLQPFRR